METYAAYFYEDLNGKPVRRNPLDYPYQYDSYVIWKENYNPEKSKKVYSDRLFSWDSQKYNQCCQDVFGNTGQGFDERNPIQVEQFLSKYFNVQIKLTAILKGCNWSTGFPIYEFVYEEK